MPGTAPDRRCAHAQLLTFTHRQLFCNHLTYSHFTLTFAHMHDVEHSCTGSGNLLKRIPILVACEPPPTGKCRRKVRGRRSSHSHHHQSTAIERATIKLRSHSSLPLLSYRGRVDFSRNKRQVQVYIIIICNRLFSTVTCGRFLIKRAKGG